MPGRIDVHSHLLPGIDDGCPNVEESLACARQMAAAGYSHMFCTPHIWPNLPDISTQTLPGWVENLQQRLDEERIAIKLMPGGEINLRPDTIELPPHRLLTFGLAGRYVMIDLWVDTLPDFFEPAIRWLQSKGMTVILAHPERMRAVQDKPELADLFDDMGLLLQGNLQCLADAPATLTRQTGERFLREGRYFLLGSDLHNLESLGHRLQGLKNAIEWVGAEAVDRLTVQNPQVLLK